ncbi:MAG: hypothetical protein Ct9H300mP14_03220 [Gammaproteobacteria bacterium]|nr:MAG: hypothetical protein Ct9H300mP14_03220 [Gammaproteobacteria bacterium]
MSGVAELRVPLRVDVGSGQTGQKHTADSFYVVRQFGGAHNLLTRFFDTSPA